MLNHVSHALKNAGMAKSPPRNPLLVIFGATGTGKSQLAIDLATRFNGEIINGDAMQMYDGLPIITNKVTVEEQQGIPHHLLGFIALDEEPWRVGMFKRKASQIIREIRSRGRLPIVVGGTHYYTQSLLFDGSLVADNIDGAEETQKSLTAQEILEKFPILEGPTEAMLERLRDVDPRMADRWHPSDRRKIKRSLEIFLLSGKKASDIYAEQKEVKSLKSIDATLEDGPCQPISDTLLFWVHSDSDILKNRLNNRVDEMLEAGLLDEIKSLNDFLRKQATSGVSVDLSRGIWVSIGWKEFEPYLAALETGLESETGLHGLYELSLERTKTTTRQYAKRQIRWIRLKLIPALLEQNALNQLYLLDGSNIALWTDDVSKPAIEIAQKFLTGSELKAPSELSEAARTFLVPEKISEGGENSVREECDICNVVCIGQERWKDHLRSRRHRALLKKRLRNPNGMSSLPKNDHKSGLDTP